MNSRLKISIIFLALSLLLIITSCKNEQHQSPSIPNAVQASPLIDSLIHEFQQVEKSGLLPGFAMSIFTKDSVFYKRGFGYADLKQKKKYQTNTVQMIASISKTLIGISLMKAVEDELITLDMDINDILPFEVRNPSFKNSPITIRQLATHTSSISDDGAYDKAYLFSETLSKDDFAEVWHKYIDVYNENVEMSMEGFLYNVFSESGKWNKNENFLNHEPGTYFEYSNIGATLLAYCIQLATGIEYKQYSEELILKNLGMNRSGWTRKEVDTINHITYYNEDYNVVPAFNCITYPDGNLFSSVDDLTKLMQGMMKGYEGQSNLLSKSSFEIMMTNQIPELDNPTGIIWDLDNDCCIGHGGNDFGIASMMYFNPKNGIGKVLMTNIAVEKDEIADAFYGVFNDMFKFDSEIVKN